ncbi:hypothetical protein GIS00_15905 [Nakamurella sp. YIM 132087]|uniref:Exo-alpha-sialidase n=1 Tax=Nakamurella alba TaxID=2665158 RepID=A0A7K1FMM7_9ACTN|nr:hypothetical protein [Nakamurella alba]MTD15422.1 hypothetical protein [Nakamurella alba]
MVVLVMIAMLSGTSPASAAAGPITKVLGDCTGYPSDAEITADGTIHGFVTCEPADVSGRDTIRYFTGRTPGSFSSKVSPYHGVVYAVAWDQSSRVYVMFQELPTPGTVAPSMRVAVYDTVTGEFSPPTPLSLPGEYGPREGDIVAYRGKWWAVWQQPTPVGGKLVQNLYQAGNLLGASGRTRITGTPASDYDVRLAYDRGVVSMVWNRAGEGIRIATTTDGRWSSSFLMAGGRPALVRRDGLTYVATMSRTTREWIVRETDNSTGRWVTHTFAVPSNEEIEPTLAVSGGRVFLTYQANLESGGGVSWIHASRIGTTWRERVGPVEPYSTYLLATVAQGGSATVLWTDHLRHEVMAQKQ